MMQRKLAADFPKLLKACPSFNPSYDAVQGGNFADNVKTEQQERLEGMLAPVQAASRTAWAPGVPPVIDWFDDKRATAFWNTQVRY
jgi:hypothetical protein